MPEKKAVTEEKAFPDGIRLVPADGVYALGLGLTSRCGFACPMCYYGARRPARPTELSLPFLRDLFARLPKMALLNLSMDGEPFCHPDVFGALDLAAEHSLGISMTSNGSLLDGETARRLGDYPVVSFFLSVDTADPELYARLRKGGSLKTFVRHAGLLADALGSRVLFNAVVSAQSLAGLPDLPALAAETGVKTVSLMQLRENPWGLAHGLRRASEEDLLACLPQLAAGAERHGVRLLFDRYFGSARIMRFLSSCRSAAVQIAPGDDNRPCRMPWTYASLLSDRTLFPCCGDFPSARLDDFSFDGIFNHPVLLGLRKALAAGRPPAPCRVCRFSD